ncbi:MAG: ATP-dependent chaperone ClpB, partial [Candidatus Dormibacteraeota bacterium]|nr:ATP-dependent chaperone ClpB [Candidatus Dormibacteraeota bacterium]
PGAVHWLAEQGYDPVYGARPLRRVLQRQLGDRIAMGILAGTYRDGDVLAVDSGEAGIEIKREVPPPAAEDSTSPRPSDELVDAKVEVLD